MSNIYLPLIEDYDSDDDDITHTIEDWRKGCYFNRRDNYTPEYMNITTTLRCNTFKGVILFLYTVHCKNFTLTQIYTN